MLNDSNPAPPPPCQNPNAKPLFSLRGLLHPGWQEQQSPGLRHAAGGAGGTVVSSAQCVLSAPTGQVSAMQPANHHQGDRFTLAPDWTLSPINQSVTQSPRSCPPLRFTHGPSVPTPCHSPPALSSKLILPNHKRSAIAQLGTFHARGTPSVPKDHHNHMTSAMSCRYHCVPGNTKKL